MFILLTTLLAAPLPVDVVFISPTECRGNHGVWRWAVKTSSEAPPATILMANKIRPSDMATWPVPVGKIDGKSPRTGREKEWFEVTGRVTLVRAEADGDLHIQLADADGKATVNVVVEVPLGKPWDEIRKTVFGWTKAKFPFTVREGERMELKAKPVIRVTGKAFFDAMHSTKKAKANRRLREDVTVWEIHPVMVLMVEKD